MDITNKIGEYDFWGMLIPGCTLEWAIIIDYPKLLCWQQLPGLESELFKWCVFLVIGYVMGLILSVLMDIIWAGLKVRNCKNLIKMVKKSLKKHYPELYSKPDFNKIDTETITTYYRMYDAVNDTYKGNPISAVEKQTILLRNLIIPTGFLTAVALLKCWTCDCSCDCCCHQHCSGCAILIGIVVSVFFVAFAILRQLKTHKIVMEYYASSLLKQQKK